jgi:hypothetical protein
MAAGSAYLMPSMLNWHLPMFSAKFATRACIAVW